MKNFFLDSKFKMLRKDMGIPDGEYANFDGLKSNEYGLKLNEIQIEELKSGGDVNITIDQLDYSQEDPILRVGNVNVVLYVRDQYYPSDYEYKYHVAWCDTLQERKNNNKIDRYVITRKDDENFNVTLIDKRTHTIMEKNTSSKMRVCRSCLRKLNYEGYRDARNNYVKKDAIYNRFSLEKFLEENRKRKSFLPNDVDVKSWIVKEDNEYPKNWNELSRAYRRKINWKCEKCHKDLSSRRWELEVHHINSCKSDCRDENLIALCNTCHGEEHQ